jgi:hypothetical protein
VSDLAGSLAQLEVEPLGDLLVGGFIDRDADGRVRFHPVTESVYLACGEALVRFRAGRDDYVVVIDAVSEITRDFPIDEDDEFGVASLFTLLLGDAYAERRIDRIRAAEVAGGVAWCELGFEDGARLRIAPMVPSGLWLSTDGPADDVEGGAVASWRRGIGWTGLRRGGG